MWVHLHRRSPTIIKHTYIHSSETIVRKGQRKIDGRDQSMECTRMMQKIIFPAQKKLLKFSFTAIDTMNLDAVYYSVKYVSYG